MGKTICRPMYLYTRTIPPIRGEIPAEYMTWGTYDGLHFGECLAKNEKDGSFDLMKLWENSVNHSFELNGTYSSQTFYLFRTEEETGSGNGQKMSDEGFFRPDDTFQFMFAVMIQLGDGLGNVLEQRKNLDEYVANCIAESDINETRYITYLTLENSDIILLIKSPSYCAGAQIIHRLHSREAQGRGLQIRYTFTVCGVLKEQLRSPRLYERLTEEIPEVRLYAIERRPQSLDMLTNMLTERFGERNVRVQQVLGTDDQCILIRHLPVNEFLKLYVPDEETALLSNSCKSYFNSVFNVTTQIGVWIASELGSTDETADPDGKLTKNMRGSLNDTYLKSWRTVGQGQNMDRENRSLLYYKALYKILNSLQKFENSPFPNYIYKPLFEPLQVFINKVIEMEKENSSECRTKEIFRFLDSVNLIVQNSSTGDRQFVTAPGFNMQSYDLPSKLISFYASFVQQVTTLLNIKDSSGDTGGGHDYKFLTCVGMKQQLVVAKILECFCPETRLMLVEVPERQMFALKESMLMLTHEVSHFAGWTIRCRKEREEYMLQSIEWMLSVGLITLFDIAEGLTLPQMQAWKNKLHELLVEEFIQYDDWHRPEQGLAHHTEYLYRKWRLKCPKVLKECKQELENCLMEERKGKAGESVQDMERRYKRKEVITRCMSSLIAEVMSHPGAGHFAFSDMVGSVIDIYKETFADLVSILTLDLSFEQYIAAFTGLLEITDNQELLRTDAFIRTAAVSCVVFYDKDKKQWPESKGTIFENPDKEKLLRQAIEKIKDEVSKQTHGKIQISDILKKPFELKRITYMDFYFISGVWNSLNQYLSLCKQKYNELVNVSEKEHLCDLFQKMSPIKNIEEAIQEIDREILSYKVGD